jgi:integrase
VVPRTAQQAKSALAEFLQIVGDKRVLSFTKDDIRNYKLALDTLPAKTRDGKLGPASIRRRMSGVIALFNYALKMELVDRNVADGLKPKRDKRRVDAERDPFSEDDLHRLFGPDYAATTIGHGGDLGQALYWVPLLALYTGARLGELAQLHTADVVAVDGIECIRICPGEDKTLKNASSERTIPLHSGLLALGFMSYVEERRAAGDRRLFPRLKKGKNRGYGGEVTNWFLKWRKKKGVDARTKPFHSFRHGLATRLKAADVREYLIAELMGHANESMSTGRYGKRVDVVGLKAAVEKVDFSAGLVDL